MITIRKNQVWEDLYQQFSHITDNLGMPIDAGILEPVVALNAVDVHTTASCEGHLDWGTPYPYIHIGSLYAAPLEERMRQAFLRQRSAKSQDAREQIAAEMEEIERSL